MRCCCARNWAVIPSSPRLGCIVDGGSRATADVRTRVAQFGTRANLAAERISRPHGRDSSTSRRVRSASTTYQESEWRRMWYARRSDELNRELVIETPRRTKSASRQFPFVTEASQITAFQGILQLLRGSQDGVYGDGDRTTGVLRSIAGWKLYSEARRVEKAHSENVSSYFTTTNPQPMECESVSAVLQLRVIAQLGNQIANERRAAPEESPRVHDWRPRKLSLAFRTLALDISRAASKLEEREEAGFRKLEEVSLACESIVRAIIVVREWSTFRRVCRFWLGIGDRSRMEKGEEVKVQGTPGKLERDGSSAAQSDDHSESSVAHTQVLLYAAHPKEKSLLAERILRAVFLACTDSRASRNHLWSALSFEVEGVSELALSSCRLGCSTAREEGDASGLPPHGLHTVNYVLRTLQGLTPISDGERSAPFGDAEAALLLLLGKWAIDLLLQNPPSLGSIEGQSLADRDGVAAPSRRDTFQSDAGIAAVLESLWRLHAERTTSRRDTDAQRVDTQLWNGVPAIVIAEYCAVEYAVQLPMLVKQRVVADCESVHPLLSMLSRHPLFSEEAFGHAHSSNYEMNEREMGWLCESVTRLVTLHCTHAAANPEFLESTGTRTLDILELLCSERRSSHAEALRRSVWEHVKCQSGQWDVWLRRVGSAELLLASSHTIDSAYGLQWLALCEASNSSHVALGQLRATFLLDTVGESAQEVCGVSWTSAVFRAFLDERDVASALSMMRLSTVAHGNGAHHQSLMTRHVPVVVIQRILLAAYEHLRTASGSGQNEDAMRTRAATIQFVYRLCCDPYRDMGETLRIVARACGTDSIGLGIIAEVVEELLRDAKQRLRLGEECEADATLFCLATLSASENVPHQRRLQQWERGLQLIDTMPNPTVHHVEFVFRLLEDSSAKVQALEWMDFSFLWTDMSTTFLSTGLLQSNEGPKQIAPEHWRAALSLLAVGMRQYSGSAIEQKILENRATSLLNESERQRVQDDGGDHDAVQSNSASRRRSAALRRGVKQLVDGFLKKPSVSFTDTVFLVAEGSFHATERVMETAKAPQRSLTALLKVATSRRDWKSALSLLRDLEEEEEGERREYEKVSDGMSSVSKAPSQHLASLSRNTSSNLIRLLCGVGRWAEAMHTLACLSTGKVRSEPDAVTHHEYLQVLRATREAAQWKSSLELLTDMVRLRMPVTYAHAAEALASFSNASAPLHALHVVLRSTGGDGTVGADGGKALQLTGLHSTSSVGAIPGDAGALSSIDTSDVVHTPLELSLIVLEAQSNSTTTTTPTAMDSNTWMAALAKVVQQYQRHASMNSESKLPLSSFISSRALRTTHSILRRSARWQEAVRLLMWQRDMQLPITDKVVVEILSGAIPNSEWQTALACFHVGGSNGKRNPAAVHLAIRYSVMHQWETAFTLVASNHIRTFTSMQFLVSASTVPLEQRIRAWECMHPRFPLSLRHQFAAELMRLSVDIARHDFTLPVGQAQRRKSARTTAMDVLESSFGKVKPRDVHRRLQHLPVPKPLFPNARGELDPCNEAPPSSMADLFELAYELAKRGKRTLK